MFAQVDNMSIFDNQISANRNYGIYMYGSMNNKMIGNNITDNSLAIFLDGGTGGNAIYHNNFINNNGNALWLWSGSYWDDGYPYGGNYWSNHVGADIYSGPYQNETGSDGIMDTPYVIGGGNIDNYPLVSPVNPEPFIYNVQITPASPNYDEDVTVSAIIIGDKDVDQAYVSYRWGQTSYDLPMTRFGDYFTATLPAHPYGVTVEFEIFANDTEGMWAVSEFYSYTVIDNVNPQIDVLQNPTQAHAGEPVKISAQIIEPVGASGVKAPVFFSYRANGEPWWNTTMIFNEITGFYERTVPAQPEGTTVEYFIKAIDEAGNVNITTVYSYTVVP
jgi:parallel beta-helix repeat protein